MKDLNRVNNLMNVMSEQMLEGVTGGQTLQTEAVVAERRPRGLTPDDSFLVKADKSRGNRDMGVWWITSALG